MTTSERGPARRLWVPGSLVVDARGGLCAGPGVGWSEPRAIDDWKRGVALVLSEGDSSLAPAVDADRFPRLSAVARACPVVARPEEEGAHLIATERRVVEVSWHRGAGAGRIVAHRAGAMTRSFQGELLGSYDVAPVPEGEARALAELINHVQGDPDVPPQDEDAERVRAAVAALVEGRGHEIEDEDVVRPTTDRVLRAVTDGELDEDAVALATDLLDATTAGDAALAVREAWLAYVEAAAMPDRADAEAIVRAIDDANDGDVVVPRYGRARRVLLPRVLVRQDGGELVLSAEVLRWVVTDGTSPLAAAPRAPAIAAARKPGLGARLGAWLGLK